MKAWLIDRGLLLLCSVAFVGGVIFLSRWIGNDNVYSIVVTMTAVALWFRVARLTKLLRQHGIDPDEGRTKLER
ncbi:hypothetical protein AB1286_14620 [Trinickia sp. NRRL B-1857]|uniref:hypothetical protein n=1 Tax=Trinickia sp. NRRL B-1857 TaxID=3162879 RepID=UPI003D2746F9